PKPHEPLTHQQHPHPIHATPSVTQPPATPPPHLLEHSQTNPDRHPAPTATPPRQQSRPTLQLLGPGGWMIPPLGSEDVLDALEGATYEAARDHSAGPARISSLDASAHAPLDVTALEFLAKRSLGNTTRNSYQLANFVR